MNEDELKRGLLNKKGTVFDKMYEDCLIKIQRIKQKNDFMQKQVGTELDDNIRGEVKKQSLFLEKQIRQVKDIMQEMEKRFKDPESRNRLKQIKAEAQKQIQRNKVILKDLINRSFINRSGGNQEEESAGYLQGGEINYEHLGVRNNTAEEKESIITDQQLEIDYDIENKMIKERSEMINDVEQATVRIHGIMNDLGVMVEEQGDNLEIISDELMKTNRNMVVANENIEEASKLQSKSRKKYLIFLLIIIIVIAAVVGFVFIFV